MSGSSALLDRHLWRQPPQGGEADQHAAEAEHAADRAHVGQPQLTGDLAAEQGAGADSQVIETGEQGHGYIRGILGNAQDAGLQGKCQGQDGSAPDKAQAAQQPEVGGGRQQHQQAEGQGEHAADQDSARMKGAAAAEDHRAGQPGATEYQQQSGDLVADQAGDVPDEGLYIAVGGELGGDADDHQGVDHHQRRTADQHWQAGQHGNAEEGDAPADHLADHPTEGNAQDHGQGGSGSDQTQGLGFASGRCNAHSQRRGDRPEHRVGQGDSHAADHQHAVTPGQEGQQMAGNEQDKYAQQQAAALDVARHQHQRQ